MPSYLVPTTYVLLRLKLLSPFLSKVVKKKYLVFTKEGTSNSLIYLI